MHRNRRRCGRLNMTRRPRLEVLEPRLPLSAMAAVASSPGVLRVQLSCPAYTLESQSDGQDRIVATGLSSFGTSGNPELPGTLLRIALPLDADLNSVELSTTSVRVDGVAGAYAIGPVAATATTDGDNVILDSASVDLVDGKNLAVYGVNAFCNTESARLVSVQQMGRWKFAEVYYSPFQYNPVAESLRVASDVSICVSYTGGAVLPAALAADTSWDAEASEMFTNYADAAAWYSSAAARPVGVAVSTIRADYAIITTSAIQSHSTQLAAFIADKQSLGHTVVVATERDWGGGSGDVASDRIRVWLQQNYASMGIKYVLLVGDPTPATGDVPMKMTWPRYSAYRSQSTDLCQSPTDYYYADLTSNWDANGNGIFGQWSVDLSSAPVQEVQVGRIPVYGSDYASLDSILAKTICYDSETDIAWRNSMLLPMAISNYGNEDRNGAPRTDGRSLAEAIKKNLATPNDFGTTTMYEQAGLLPVTAACDAPLTEADLLAQWRASDYGIVDWWGHGNHTLVARKYWSADTDEDGVADSNEITWVRLLNSADTALLDNAHPSVVVQVSCLNGFPEDSGNLGYALLRNGAIGTYSATRDSWYTEGTWTARQAGDNASMAYYITRQLVNNPATETLGSALEWCRESLNCSNAEFWMNLVGFNLYGDPSVTPYTVGPRDLTPPTASALAADVAAGGGSSYTFTVTYSDADSSISMATLGSKNVVVTGPNKFSQIAKLVSVDDASNGPVRTATYRITPPGGKWNPADNGVYTMSMRYGQVSDTALNFVPADSLGTFTAAILPTVSISGVSHKEGKSGVTTVSMVVTLSARSGQPVDVSYATADGSAVAGQDYVAAAGTVHFPAGTTRQTIKLQIVGDTTYEAREAFGVTLSDASGAVIGATKGSATVTVVNDDKAPKLTIGDGVVVQTPEGPVARFTVSLSGLTDLSAAVTCTTANGTAKAGKGFAATTALLTFLPGETSKEFVVPILADAALKRAESFYVKLSGTVQASVARGKAKCVIPLHAGAMVTNLAAAATPAASSTQRQEAAVDEAIRRLMLTWVG